MTIYILVLSILSILNIRFMIIIAVKTLIIMEMSDFSLLVMGIDSKQNSISENLQMNVQYGKQNMNLKDGTGRI
jgi:hypothetical protein